VKAIERSPSSEGDSHSDSQEILRLLSNSKVHYCTTVMRLMEKPVSVIF
jgi:hypothetical protein